MRLHGIRLTSIVRCAALQVREYMEALEGHLAEAHRQAQRLLKRQTDLGAAMAEFGAAMAAHERHLELGLRTGVHGEGNGESAPLISASTPRCCPAGEGRCLCPTRSLQRCTSHDFVDYVKVFLSAS